MYVDDVLAGNHMQQSAVSAIKGLRGALESAGFPLRKWTSTEKKLLQDIRSKICMRIRPYPRISLNPRGL